MRDSTLTGSLTGSRPKTRTEPVWALSKPSTWRISVVFPAPLAPTRPKTTPRGTVRLTLSSARLVPNLRVTLWISITLSGECEPLANMASFFLVTRHCRRDGWLHLFVPFLNELDERFGVDVHLPGFCQQGVDPFGDD